MGRISAVVGCEFGGPALGTYASGFVAKRGRYRGEGGAAGRWWARWWVAVGGVGGFEIGVAGTLGIVYTDGRQKARVRVSGGL